MSTDQTPLQQFTPDPNRLFNNFRDFISGVTGRVLNTAASAGIDLEWLTQSPLNTQPDGDVWVYQYVEAYSKGSLGERYGFRDPRGKRPIRDGSPSPEVQFKTGIYVVGEPTDEIEHRISDIDNSRLITLFDTDVYAGYMSGFGFSERDVYVQRERVSAREVEAKGYGLGVPWFEVEAYDEDGNLSGLADGYFNPFSTVTKIIDWERGEDPPQQEVWKFGSRQKHESGDRYQISPPPKTPARERAKNATGKTAIINGFPVGSVLDGGRLRLKVEYRSPNRAKFTSRKQIIEGSGTPYQALSEGANLYKVRETDDQLIFSTKPPEGFDAPDPEDISPDAVGVETGTDEVTEILLDDDEPTEWVVETDKREDLPPDGRTGRMLGLYDPIVTRDIERGTDLI